MTEEEKERISELVGDYVSSTEGRQKVAIAMSNLIRQKLQEPSRSPFVVTPCCSDCGMPETAYGDGGHSGDECTVYRVMES